MHDIRIIGSTDFGWHVVADLHPNELIGFAYFGDVHFFNVTIGGAHLAPSTIYGFAKAAGCPFTLGDAHAVLAMIRPLLMTKETTDGPVNRCG